MPAQHQGTFKMTLHRISYIKAQADTKPLREAFSSLLAGTTLSRLVRQQLVEKFGDAGLFNPQTLRAAKALDDSGRFKVAIIDAALKSFPTIVRLEVKNALWAAGAIPR